MAQEPNPDELRGFDASLLPTLSRFAVGATAVSSSGTLHLTEFSTVVLGLVSA